MGTKQMGIYKGKGFKMTAIQALKHELKRIQEAIEENTTDSGIVYGHKKYLVGELAKQAKSIQSSIDWMERLKNE